MTAPTTPPTDADLLEHAGFVRYLARALVVGEAEADDLFQDAYLTALRSPPRRSTNLRGWLATVVRNLARMRHRTDRRRIARESAAARADRESAPDDTAARLEIQRLLVDAVASLDEPFRTTVVLRYFDGMKPAEIARRQAVPSKTVHSRLARALDRLRGRLDREHGGSRSVWRAALLPLAGLAVSGTARAGTGAAAAATLTGGILMGVKLKVGLVAAAVVVAGVAVWQSVVPEPGPAPGTEETEAPAGLPPSMPLRSAADDQAGGDRRVVQPEDQGLLQPARSEVAEATEDRETWRVVATILDHSGAPAPGARLVFSNERHLASERRRLEMQLRAYRSALAGARSDSARESLTTACERLDKELADFERKPVRIHGTADAWGRGAVEIPGPGHLHPETHDATGVAVSLRPPWDGDREVVLRLEAPDPFGPQAPMETWSAGAGGTYGGRGGHRNLKANGGGKDTEDAVAAGLFWLRKHQLPDGGWQAVGGSAEPAVTGLALLAFLGAGETHLHGNYKKTVGDGLARLLSIQDGSGGFGAGGEAESTNHSIATQAVAEAWAITGSKKLGETARRALEFLAATAPSAELDPKETVWAACALIAGVEGKLPVDGEALDWASQRLGGVLNSAKRSDGAVVAGALYCRAVLDPGTIRTKEHLRGMRSLLKHIPRVKGRNDRADFPTWHFATLALFPEQGSSFKKWNGALKKALVGLQRTDGDEKGSWDPHGPDSEVLGRAGVTALAVCTLETYYRYQR